MVNTFKSTQIDSISRDLVCSSLDQSDRILIGSSKGILVLNKSTLNIIQTLTLKTDPYFTPLSLSFSKEGKDFICWDNSNNGRALLWNLESGEYQVVFKRPSEFSAEESTYRFIFINDHHVLVIGQRDLYFEIGDGNISNPERYKTHISYLNLTSNKVDDEWLLEKSYIGIEMISGNRLLCSSGRGMCVDVYDVNKRKLIKTLRVDFPVYTAKLCSKQKYLVCSDSNTLVVYDFETMNFVKKFKVSGDQVHDFSISQNNRNLVVSEYTESDCYDENLRYYDFETQDCLATVPCDKYLRYVFMDHSKQTLLTIDDKNVRLIKYRAACLPTLAKICVSAIQENLGFFRSKTLAENQKNVLNLYFDIEEKGSSSLFFGFLKNLIKNEDEMQSKTSNQKRICSLM